MRRRASIVLVGAAAIAVLVALYSWNRDESAPSALQFITDKVETVFFIHNNTAWGFDIDDRNEYLFRPPHDDFHRDGVEPRLAVEGSNARIPRGFCYVEFTLVNRSDDTVTIENLSVDVIGREDIPVSALANRYRFLPDGFEAEATITDGANGLGATIEYDVMLGPALTKKSRVRLRLDQSVAEGMYKVRFSVTFRGSDLQQSALSDVIYLLAQYPREEESLLEKADNKWNVWDHLLSDEPVRFSDFLSELEKGNLQEAEAIISRRITRYEALSQTGMTLWDSEPGYGDSLMTRMFTRLQLGDDDGARADLVELADLTGDYETLGVVKGQFNQIANNMRSDVQNGSAILIMMARLALKSSASTSNSEEPSNPEPDQQSD